VEFFLKYLWLEGGKNLFFDYIILKVLKKIGFDVL